MNHLEEIANEILDNWQEHMFDSHPERMIAALSDEWVPPLSCAVCTSLRGQIEQLGRA